MIRTIKKDDIPQICDIYNYYIENTIISFEEEPVPVIEMEKRVSEITASLPWIVYEEDGDVVGYAYAGKWKARYAYRFSVEVTVYVRNNVLGKGVGSKLYGSLIADLKSKGIHAAVAGIALPNERSRRLHEKMGFKKVAHFEQTGFKFNNWIDVGYWELIINTYA